MAVVWDRTMIRCDGPGCVENELLPEWLLEDDEPDIRGWLTRRAWATVAGLHYCPNHW